jgi:hypothetical protein
MFQTNKFLRTLFFCVAGILVSLFFSNAIAMGRVKHTFSNGMDTVVYETQNGLFDGMYNSFYKNGNKKSVGQFSNNMRVGLWTVYDSLGNKKMQRNYKNNFEYEQIFPTLPKEGPIKVLSQSYKLNYNKNGFIDYFYLDQRAIVVFKKIWREIGVENNPNIFSGNKLFHLLVDSLIAKKYTAYEDGGFDFKDTISKQNLARLIDTANYDVVGYDIMEDWFFDNDRMLSETRILGIRPVIRDRKTMEKQDVYTYHLGWFRFYQIRNGIAKIKLEDKTCPKNIRTLDDLFFFRYFEGSIRKESIFYDEKISDFIQKRDLGKGSEGIAISLIEMEHDIWIKFSK